jgi:hypothetical protein
MKDGIISFRLPPPFDGKIKAAYGEARTTVVGLKSENHLARKVLVDFLEGRLVYLNPADKVGNPIISNSARNGA